MKKLTFLIVMLMVVVTKAQLVITTIPLNPSLTISYVNEFRTPLLNTTVTPIVQQSSFDYTLYNELFKPVVTPVNNITINNITVKDNGTINVVQFSTDLHNTLFK